MPPSVATKLFSSRPSIHLNSETKILTSIFLNVLNLPCIYKLFVLLNYITMRCRRSSTKRGGRGGGSVPVYLNVYDLTSINGYAYWLGLGVYHSGIQVHAIEYAFGAHENSTTGIFEGEPKHCEGFTFRKSILMGWTDMTPGEVRGVMEEFALKYRGNAYNLITKNCNHFCNDACIKLAGNSIPSWVNRLARISLFCNCIIPLNLKSMKFGHLEIEDKVCEGEEKKLRSSSSLSHSSPLPTTTASRSRSCLQGSSAP